MKVALVYDRVNKFGGAERLMLALHRLFPDAPIFTLVYDPETALWAKGLKVIPTFLNKFKFLRRKHEWLAPIAPLAFETHDLSGYDMVISITSSDAKSVLTKPRQLHLCYCLTPTRYFWSGESEYSADTKMKLIPKFLKNYFRVVDLSISTRPDHYIAISEEVKKRIKKYYHRPSSVIFPPIEDKFYSLKPTASPKRDYYLAVGRLVPYKKFDLIVEAFNRLGLSLVIVGTGSELSKLKRASGPNIKFDDQADDDRLVEYYRHAKAVIFPQDEDFGLVPVEAQALGTPVIAFGKGGALETVINKKTGLFFPEQTAASLAAAVKDFEKLKLKPQDCVANAKKFNYSNFAKQFSSELSRLWQQHCSKSDDHGK